VENSAPTRRKKIFLVIKLTSVKVGALYSIGKQFETLQKQLGKVLEVFGELCPVVTEKNLFGPKLGSLGVLALKTALKTVGNAQGTIWGTYLEYLVNSGDY
jgi:hypothetical protein